MTRHERARVLESNRRAFLRTVAAGGVAAGALGTATETTAAETEETEELIRIVGGGTTSAPTGSRATTTMTR